MLGFLASDTTPGTTGGMLDGFVVGTEHHYSSYGPVVASRIVEILTGRSPIDYMRDRILRDLNLTHTSFIGFDETPAALVIGHGADDGMTARARKETPPREIQLAVSSGSGGAFVSTACDMVNFARDISDPGVGFLPAATIDSRITTPSDVGGVYEVGRGVFNHHGFGSGSFWSHADDGMSGHSSLVGYNPMNGVSATVLANLRPLYIENGHSLHFEIFGILSAYPWP
jgi:CubicO group peptidase (beta-lactamase class C family)